MKVRPMKACRIEVPRGDGTPGFRDLAPGQEIEIEDGAFDPTLYEVVDGETSVKRET